MSKHAKATASFSDAVGERDEQKREALIEKLVAQMTAKEKLSLLSGHTKLREYIDYSSSTFDAGGCARLGVPPIRFTDGPRGVMLNRSTCFPASMARGATWEPELETRVGEAIGKEAFEQGANLSGSVCINLLRHPAWGRAQETYGEDPHHVGEMGAAQVRGLQRHIMACVKHFAANSIENARFWVDVSADDRTLMEVYLPHFKKCVEAGAAAVMGAHNKINGTHCGHSRRLLTDILKNDWGFDGFTISDWTFGIRGPGALDAGLDIEMPNSIFYGLPLKWRIMQGKTGMERVDDAARRILRQLARFHKDKSEAPSGSVACREHAELAREVARKSVVLLKNDRKTLPLNAEKIRKIAVVGGIAGMENIGDRSGSSNLKPPYVITLLEGIKQAAGDAVVVEHIDGNRLEEVKRSAEAADAVIVAAGLTCADEGECILPLLTKGGDRSRLTLPDGQEAMIRAAAAANKNCVVVLEGGSAILMESWIEEVPAVLMAWYPGMEGGAAVAEALFGRSNPGGKLPIAFPRSEAQLPLFNKWAKKIRYELFHGYRHFDRNRIEPRFPFGFGLSYTTFEFGNLNIDAPALVENRPIITSCDVANVGETAGDETVQLYMGYPGSAVERPVRELKGFRRVSIEPGETKTVSIAIQPQDLAYYDPVARGWKIEDLEYEVFLGSSSSEKDLTLKGSFRLGRKAAGELEKVGGTV